MARVVWCGIRCQELSFCELVTPNVSACVLEEHFINQFLRMMNWYIICVWIHLSNVNYMIFSLFFLILRSFFFLFISFAIFVFLSLFLFFVFYCRVYTELLHLCDATGESTQSICLKATIHEDNCYYCIMTSFSIQKSTLRLCFDPLSNILIYVISCVCPPGWMGILISKNLNFGYCALSVQPDFSSYHFIPLSLTLALAGGHKAKGKQNMLASFSCTHSTDHVEI